MVIYIEKYGKLLQLQEVYLKVSKENIRAIKMYEKMGYVLKQENDNFFEYKKNIGEE